MEDASGCKVVMHSHKWRRSMVVQIHSLAHTN